MAAQHWTTDTGLDWAHVIGWGMAGAAGQRVHLVRPQGVLNKELGCVIERMEHDHTGCVKPYKGCMPPMFPTYSVHYKTNPLGGWDPDMDLKYELHAALPGVLEFTAPLEAAVVRRFHMGGKDPADVKGYDEVCSDAYVAWGGRDAYNVVNYTYPGGERRRFNVTYAFHRDEADKLLVFRCSSGSRMAVFLDTVLGTDIAGTVDDMIEHPERYACGATRRVRARTTTDVV